MTQGSVRWHILSLSLINDLHGVISPRLAISSDNTMFYSCFKCKSDKIKFAGDQKNDPHYDETRGVLLILTFPKWNKTHFKEAFSSIADANPKEEKK